MLTTEQIKKLNEEFKELADRYGSWQDSIKVKLPLRLFSKFENGYLSKQLEPFPIIENTLEPDESNSKVYGNARHAFDKQFVDRRLETRFYLTKTEASIVLIQIHKGKRYFTILASLCYPIELEES